jgi:hypothetical protein
MNLEQVMHTYFRGERLESYVFIVPLGVLCILFGIATLYGERSPFAWGISVPFMLLGGVLLVTGLGIGLRTPGQVAALTALYQRDVPQFATQELQRMQIVNSNWPRYVTTWTIFTLIGLGLRFGVHREWALGLGTALMFFGAVGFMIDGFAERRAKPYTAALENLAAQTQERK